MSDLNSWEFEAPRFIDFGANEHNLNDNADDYFDHTHDNNKSPFGFLQSFDGTSSANLIDASESKKDLDVNSNISEERVVSSSAMESVEYSVLPLRSEVKKDLKRRCKSFAGANLAAELPLSNVLTPSRVNKWKTRKPITAVFTSAKKSIPTRITNLRRSARLSGRYVNKTSHQTQEPPNKKQKVITLKTPSGKSMSFKPGQSKCLTSEERELEEMKRLRDEAKRFKVEAKKQLKKLERHTTVKQAPAKVTCPKEFHFQTDKRMGKSHSMTTRSDCDASTDFSHELRKYDPSPLRHSKITVAKPFKFASDRKRKLESGREIPLVPRTKAALDFHKAPTSYKFSGRKAKGLTEVNKPLRVTHPRSPQFSKPHNRPTSIQSAKEKEELEVEEMRSYQFKAQPVRRSVLSGAEALKKIEKKAPTIPIGFDLSTNRRSNAHPLLEIAEKVKPFKALPIPPSLYEKPMEMKKKETQEVTVPVSPAFSTKHRIKQPLANLQPDEPQPQSFYHPPPSTKRVYRPKLNSTKTESVPFSFDSADKERFSKKEEKIEETISKEKEVPAFKAQPMPQLGSPSTALPPKQTKEATKTTPFKLTCDERAALRVSEWSKNIADEVREMREKRCFKANTNYEKVTRGKLWEPKPSQKQLTEPLPFQLRSNQRAKIRGEHERQIKEENTLKEALLAEELKSKEEKEKQELADLRRSRVFKAQGVKRFKSVEIAHSEKKLTFPESPNFSKRFKK